MDGWKDALPIAGMVISKIWFQVIRIPTTCQLTKAIATREPAIVRHKASVHVSFFTEAFLGPVRARVLLIAFSFSANCKVIKALAVTRGNFPSNPMLKKLFIAVVEVRCYTVQRNLQRFVPRTPGGKLKRLGLSRSPLQRNAPLGKNCVHP